MKEVIMNNQRLINGECLETMDKLIEEGIKFDAIITDPPYQATNCAWDTLIPFNKYILMKKTKRSKKMIPVYRDDYILRELKEGRDYKEICNYFDNNSKEGMWDKLNKLIKPNGAIVLFGSEPFSSQLRNSNIKEYKYDWKWDKKGTGGFLNAKKRPLKRYEDILIFSKGVPLYFPIKEIRGKPRNKDSYNKKEGNGDMVYGKFDNQKSFNNEYYPTDILEISNASQKGKVHPTQKPVSLIEYLIKTYTNENELILDFTSGSFTTSLACKNTNRKSIGIELDEKYYNIGIERLND